MTHSHVTLALAAVALAVPLSSTASAVPVVPRITFQQPVDALQLTPPSESMMADCQRVGMHG